MIIKGEKRHAINAHLSAKSQIVINLRCGIFNCPLGIAAITASKKTSDLIPLCHNINLASVSVVFKINTSKKYVYCEANVSTSGKTGVEMEALTTVQIGLLTIYDMCKSIDKGMRITDIQLELKKGGASGEWRRTK